MMCIRSVASLCALVACAPITNAQTRVPIIDLPTATRRGSDTLGAILGVKQVSGGMLLVNDAVKRQVRLYDSTLAHYTIVVDSAPGTSQSYGILGSPLISYLGDSSLLLDYQSRAFLLLDGRGQVRHSVALPNADAISSFSRSGSSVDPRGRLLYRNIPPTNVSLRRSADGTGVSNSRITQPVDSAEIVRVDLDSRRIDTVGVVNQVVMRLSPTQLPGGGQGIKVSINPLRTVDEWAMLSDGTLAFVRGHDYHVDWILADGTRRSTEKLPFDWKRLTDADKQQLIDSARVAQNAKTASRGDAAQQRRTGDDAGGSGSGATTGGGRGGQRSAGGSLPSGGAPTIVTEFVALSEMADYYPRIRDGAALADLEGNLWILPTTSAQSRNGELVYDVLNPKDGLFKRVRVPIGRSIVGFGKNGTVYLMVGNRTTGFVLEQSRWH